MLIIPSYVQWLTDRHKKALYEALEKVKTGIQKFFCSPFYILEEKIWLCSLIDLLLLCTYVMTELMILGFISLLLVFSQYYIAKICVPYKVADSMLPCPVAVKSDKKEENRRRLLWYERRVLAGGYKSSCKEVICIQCTHSWLKLT